ncbi:imidazole glycerol phosphate synthase subunit HisH [SAR116 cluster bacterium]|nr:imidazole glycerol phosphate synthase subunit HisH [SAR116 cluster bacterium]
MSLIIGIVDYGLANMKSVINAFDYLEQKTKVAVKGTELTNVDALVLPGVGAFDKSMEQLRARGHEDALNELVLYKNKPILGICLGMQLFCNGSEEGLASGLGWINTKCVEFDNSQDSIRVPHIGWTEVALNRQSALFDNIAEYSDFYFVHSYYVPVNVKKDGVLVSSSVYGVEFAATIQVDNIYGCQFHPEKSQMAGLKLLDNFIAKVRNEQS